VLIHWQDSEADPTSIHTLAELEQTQIDDFRRDELRRLSKAAIIYAQRDTQLSLGELSAVVD
jgi:hypothetical protein